MALRVKSRQRSKRLADTRCEIEESRKRNTHEGQNHPFAHFCCLRFHESVLRRGNSCHKSNQSLAKVTYDPFYPYRSGQANASIENHIEAKCSARRIVCAFGQEGADWPRCEDRKHLEERDISQVANPCRILESIKKDRPEDKGPQVSQVEEHCINCLPEKRTLEALSCVIRESSNH